MELNAMSDGGDEPVAADSQNVHHGFRKLFAKLHRRSAFTGRESKERDICNFLRACLFCHSRKSVPDSKSGLPQRLPETTRFGSMMAYDIVGPFNKTKSDNQYVLTMMDMYSRYVEAYLSMLLLLRR
jgi:hypothetical protein